MPAPGYPRPEYSYPSDYNQTIEEIIKQRDEAIAERDVARNCAEHWEKLCDDARQVACEQYTALLKCEGYRHSYQVEAEYQEQRALKAEHDERQFHQMWIKADAEWEKAAQERDETGYQLIEAKGDITFHKYLAGEWRDACFKADANSAELVEVLEEIQFGLGECSLCFNNVFDGHDDDCRVYIALETVNKDGCVEREREELERQNAELVEALERFINVSGSFPHDLECECASCFAKSILASVNKESHVDR